MSSKRIINKMFFCVFVFSFCFLVLKGIEEMEVLF